MSTPSWWKKAPAGGWAGQTAAVAATPVGIREKGYQRYPICAKSSRTALLFFFDVEGMSFGQHALMQDAGNENASRLLAIEHDVLAILHATQARPNMMASSAQCKIAGQHLATSLKLAEITDGLVFAPSP
jgi:hypothetical protein